MHTIASMPNASPARVPYAWTLSSSVRPHELSTQVWHHPPGAAARLTTLGDILRTFPADDALRSYRGDFLPLVQGAKEWMLQHGMGRVVIRRPRDIQPKMSTPWGAADSATSFGPGVMFYGTPSHGGFKLDAKALRSIPQDVLRETAGGGRGLQGWFEEDEDAQIVVLAFPKLFDAQDMPEAWTQLVGRGWHRAATFWHGVAESDGPGVNRAAASSICEKMARRRAAIIAWNPPGKPENHADL